MDYWSIFNIVVHVTNKYHFLMEISRGECEEQMVEVGVRLAKKRYQTKINLFEPFYRIYVLKHTVVISYTISFFTT